MSFRIQSKRKAWAGVQWGPPTLAPAESANPLSSVLGPLS